MLCYQAIDGVIFVTNGNFKLMYVSEKCLPYLGYQNIDMIGHDIVHFVHPSEAEELRTWLENAKSNLLKTNSSISDRLTYRCRIQERNQPRSEATTYQMVQISGYLGLRLDDRSSQMKKIRLIRAKNGHTSAKVEILEEGGNSGQAFFVSPQDIIFKGVIELCKTNPLAELNLLEANLDEYILRMTLDGVILYADHRYLFSQIDRHLKLFLPSPPRIHLVTGFSPSEVEGRSAYEFVMPEDHGISFFAHRNSKYFTEHVFSWGENFPGLLSRRILQILKVPLNF